MRSVYLADSTNLMGKNKWPVCSPQSVRLKQDENSSGTRSGAVLFFEQDFAVFGTSLNHSESIFCAKKPGGEGGVSGTPPARPEASVEGRHGLCQPGEVH